MEKPSETFRASYRNK